MTDLLINEPFASHSGLMLPFKIDADALTDADLATVANVVSKRLTFGAVHFVPRGGARFAAALIPHRTSGAALRLIVDDVLTTGASMDAIRRLLIDADWTVPNPVGLVLFARGPCPSWILPFFTLHEAWR